MRPPIVKWSLVTEAFDMWKHLSGAQSNVTGDDEKRARLKMMARRAWERYMRRADEAAARFQQVQLESINTANDSQPDRF